MPNQEQQFINELEVFRTEAQAGLQFLYAYLSFHSIISKNKKTYREINKTPLFWKTINGSLQTSFFILLGRIFDHNSTHNISRLIKIAQENKKIFSKKALAKRKRKHDPNADEWISDYLKSVYEPTANDFRELRKKIEKFRKIYELKYRDIRHKIFAHKEVSDDEDVQKLFRKTNIRELQRVFLFVNALYEVLWQLFYNGRKPVFRHMRYSVRSMIHSRKPEWQKTLQERMVDEVSYILKALTNKAQQDTSHRRTKKQQAI